MEQMYARLRKPACSCGGTCARCESARPHAQHASHADHAGHASSLSAAAPVLDRAGEPLHPAVRAQMEPRFGADFSGVRIHSGAEAEASARAVQARAFTVGQHIVFGAGEYAPHTPGGQRTLAHELTHTLQQRHATSVQRLTIGPSDDAHEREADHIASAVLSPASAMTQPRPTPLSVQRMQRLTDSQFEHSAGVDTGISNGTMTTVGGVHGTTANASNCFGAADCKLHFEFAKAYKGTYPYAAANGRVVRGIYAKIVARPDESCWACSRLELVQTLRNTTVGARGSLTTADPGTDVRRQRSGWGNASAPSRGWRVDRIESATNPFFTQGSNGQSGDYRNPAILWDAPGDWDTDRSMGKDFQTCLICTSGSSRYALGCVTWGYTINAAGAVTFSPTPAASCGSTTELRDAAKRWDAIPGNQGIRLNSSSPPRPAGETPRPLRPGDPRSA